MDFILRDVKSIIPVEVKASDNATYSLNKLIEEKQYKIWNKTVIRILDLMVNFILSYIL